MIVQRHNPAYRLALILMKELLKNKSYTFESVTLYCFMVCIFLHNIDNDKPLFLDLLIQIRGRVGFQLK